MLFRSKDGSLAGFGAEASAQLDQQRALQEELTKLQREGQDNRLKDLEAWYQQKLLVVGTNEQLQNSLTEEYEKRKTLITEQQNQMRLSLTANVLGQAANLLGKQTAAGKALAVAQATIDTYQSAVAAYKSLVGIPVVGPALATAAAGVAIAAGFKNIKTRDSHAPAGLDIHEMGGVRMGKDPKTSVLNKWNQVWGAKNVFVTDGAAMTSASCVNPSLTYMALTARAADFAVKEMKKRNI